MMWKKLGKEGLAVHAPWPVAGEENKMLARQSTFLRVALKWFRTTVGKAKKGWTTATIVVSESYPDWKVKLLSWAQTQFNEETGFSPTYMKDLKAWASANVSDKKLLKQTMQIGAFLQGEVRDVGPAAMDTQVQFDQKALLNEVLAHIKKQTNISEISIVKVGDESAGLTEKVADVPTPGKPYLWLR